MINLDDHLAFATIDPQNMLFHIDSLPNQLEVAWKLSHEFGLPSWRNLRQVVFAGMGGSAIGADLLATYITPLVTTPVVVWRDYELPGWAFGPETLVIASSHSGNTEETLDAYRQGLARGCNCLAVCTGGKLAQLAAAAQQPLWQFEHHGQPRTAVGFSFGLLLSALARLGLLSDPQDELEDAISEMRRQQQDLIATSPASRNPAKRYAGQLMGRWAVVIASGLLAPVARRWKTQINELAKTWAEFDIIPEVDHNTLAGLTQPEEPLTHLLALFLRAPADHPRNRLRSDLTRKLFMLSGLNTDFVDARGETRLAQLWTCLHFGDYLAYYLAIAYGIDPTPVEMLESFKAEIKNAP